MPGQRKAQEEGTEFTYQDGGAQDVAEPAEGEEGGEGDKKKRKKEVCALV